MSELVQGFQDGIHENAVPDEPGIVERRPESMFVPVELTQTLIDISEEPMLLRTDRALDAEATMIYSQARADSEVTVIVLASDG